MEPEELSCPPFGGGQNSSSSSSWYHSLPPPNPLWWALFGEEPSWCDDEVGLSHFEISCVVPISERDPIIRRSSVPCLSLDSVKGSHESEFSCEPEFASNGTSPTGGLSPLEEEREEVPRIRGMSTTVMKPSSVLNWPASPVV